MRVPCRRRGRRGNGCDRRLWWSGRQRAMLLPEAAATAATAIGLTQAHFHEAPPKEKWADYDKTADECDFRYFANTESGYKNQLKIYEKMKGKILNQISGGKELLRKDGNYGAYIWATTYDKTTDGKIIRNGKKKGEYTLLTQEDFAPEDLRQVFLCPKGSMFTNVANDSAFNPETSIWDARDITIINSAPLAFFGYASSLGTIEKGFQAFLNPVLQGKNGRLLHCQDSDGKLQVCEDESKAGRCNDESNPHVVGITIFDFKHHLEQLNCRIRGSTGQMRNLEEKAGTETGTIEAGTWSATSDAFLSTERLRKNYDFFTKEVDEGMMDSREIMVEIIKKRNEVADGMQRRLKLGPMCYSFAMIQVILRRYDAAGKLDEGLKRLGIEGHGDILISDAQIKRAFRAAEQQRKQPSNTVEFDEESACTPSPPKKAKTTDAVVDLTVT